MKFTTLGLHLLGVFLCSCVVKNSADLTILPDPENPDGYIVYRQELEAVRDEKTQDPLYAVWSDAVKTRPNSEVEPIVPGRAENPSNVLRAERVFSQDDWNFLTPHANPLYTYTGFLKSIGKFPSFCGDYSDGRDADALCKKCIILAFTHYAQETGMNGGSSVPKWRQGLYHLREWGYQEGDIGYNQGCDGYYWPSIKWPCAPNTGYFGRGSKQLSYHYNYGPFSESMYDGDATVLLNNPALVADTWYNLASSIWFFVTPQSPKPAMLHVVDRTWVPSEAELSAQITYGLGTTINIINGGLECGTQTPQAANRVSYWRSLVAHYNIHIESDEVDTCHQQTPYDQVNLAGHVLPINWDRSYEQNPNNPGRYPFECVLTGQQTAYSALFPGDYEKCVANHYNLHGTDWPPTRVVDMPNHSSTGAPPTGPATTAPATTAPATTAPATTAPATTAPATTAPGCERPPSNDYQDWVEGGFYDTNTGVFFECKCYTSKNCPGPNDSPNNPYYWDEVPCIVAPRPTGGPTICPTHCPRPENPDYRDWVPGMEWDVSYGAFFECKCYLAINCPGPNDSPNDPNFWDEVPCIVAPRPTDLPPICGTTTTTPCPLPEHYIPYVRGETWVKNGVGVFNECKCHTAINCPGPFDSPPNEYFWPEVSCDVVPVEDTNSCPSTP